MNLWVGNLVFQTISQSYVSPGRFCLEKEKKEEKKRERKRKREREKKENYKYKFLEIKK